MIAPHVKIEPNQVQVRLLDKPTIPTDRVANMPATEIVGFDMRILHMNRTRL
jgi:hypothetical protein